MILEGFLLQGDHEEIKEAGARLKIVDINGAKPGKVYIGWRGQEFQDIESVMREFMGGTPIIKRRLE